LIVVVSSVFSSCQNNKAGGGGCREGPVVGNRCGIILHKEGPQSPCGV
jgi:hypothetical protein